MSDKPTAQNTPDSPTAHHHILTPALTIVMATACGLLVANLYYAQAVIGPISHELGLNAASAGLIVMLMQLGYAAGLLLITCLADLVENRRVVLITLTLTVLGLVGIAVSPDAALFLAASFIVGACSSAAQILVPMATHLAPDEKRGRVIGNVMGGLMAGIMLARPFANFITALLGWRAVFVIGAVLCAAILVVLWFRLPHRNPLLESSEPRSSYGRVVASAFGYLGRERALQRRMLYQFLVFGAFNMFWTAVPLVLAGRFGLGQFGIALFALAGAGGAMTAPIAGRLADRKRAALGTALALSLVAVSFFGSAFAVAATALVPLIIAAVVIDGASQGNQILGQRIIYGIDASARGRINSVYMFAMFIGGACGSFVAPILFDAGGWTLIATVGAIVPLVMLAIWATERIDPKLAGPLNG